MLWDVPQCLLVVTGVSGQTIGALFKRESVSCLFKVRPTGFPETWVTTNKRLTPQKSQDLIFDTEET